MELIFNNLYLLLNIKNKYGYKSICYELNWNTFFPNNWSTNFIYLLEKKKLTYRLNSIVAKNILKIPIKNIKSLPLQKLYLYNIDNNNYNYENIYFYDFINKTNWNINAILFVPIQIYFNNTPSFLISSLTALNDLNHQFYCSFNDLMSVLNNCINYKFYNGYKMWYSDYNNKYQAHKNIIKFKFNNINNIKNYEQLLFKFN